ncbi:MAG: TetR/AcrR family transcriptional regulator [Eubacteriales bacterium]
MAQYKKGMNTKHKILAVSKRLFYENGYVDTSCKKICEEADVNLGLIHYYFKSKKNIASIIYTYFLIDVKDLVKKIMTDTLDNYELKYATAIENWVYMSLLLKHEGYKQFYYEICRESLLLDENTKVIEFFFKLHNNTYGLNLTNNDIKLIRVVNAVSGMGLVEKYVEGYFDMSLEELIEYKIRNMYRLMKLKEEQIDDIIETSYRIFRDIHIGISDYFRVYPV